QLRIVRAGVVAAQALALAPVLPLPRVLPLRGHAACARGAIGVVLLAARCPRGEHGAAQVIPVQVGQSACAHLLGDAQSAEEVALGGGADAPPTTWTW